MDQTPITLLERLRQPDDEDAWRRFVRLYTPLLFYWGRRCGLQQQDAADLTQEVFATLVRKLPEFVYEPGKSFRAWLRTVTLNHWRDRQRRMAHQPAVGTAHLPEVPGPESSQLFEEAEYRQQLLERALHLIRGDFEAATWTAFWEHGVLGRPAPEVAREQGITMGAVYGAKFRILTRLRQELTGLMDS